MNNERIIFVETDSTFGLALHVFEQLRPNLVETYSKTVSIEGIRSARNQDHIFPRLNDLTRTVSSSLRKCFLESVNIHPNFWPKFSRGVLNQQTMPSMGPNRMFHLTNDVLNSNFYFSKYDQLNPPFVIKYSIKNNLIALRLPNYNWTSRMIIIQNLQLLTFVTTTVNIGRGQMPHEYNCNVRVICNHYQITDIGPGPLQALDPLRMMMYPTQFRLVPLPREPVEIPGDELEQSDDSDEEEDENGGRGDEQQARDQDQDVDENVEGDLVKKLDTFNINK